MQRGRKRNRPVGDTRSPPCRSIRGRLTPALQDALASLRRHLGGQRIISMLGKRLGHDGKLGVLLEALARAA